MTEIAATAWPPISAIRTGPSGTRVESRPARRRRAPSSSAPARRIVTASRPRSIWLSRWSDISTPKNGAAAHEREIHNHNTIKICLPVSHPQRHTQPSFLSYNHATPRTLRTLLRLSMSYKDKLSGIQRDGPASVTSQIVDVFAAAIAAGELGADEKLPPTRELAELAQVNHLTAARAYRRLAEMGLVTARVGQGTFVRVGAQSGAAAGEGEGADRQNTDWQYYALPEELETYGDRILAEMFRQAGRDDVVPLMVGYPSDKLLPAERLTRITAEVLSEAGTRAHQYTDIEGLAELREQIAALHRAEGCDESPDQVLATTGVHQAMTLTARAILRPGDAAACESPTFPGSIEALRNTGASVLPVRVDEGGLDVDGLEVLLRRRDIRMLALQPRLHNPTGRDLAPERRERLCELAARYGFFIVEDGAYAPLRFEGDPVPPLRAMLPSHVIYMSSFSKTVSPGMRTGWLSASGPVLERIIREKRNDDIHSATFTQLVSARFLADGGYEDQLDRAIPFYRERHDA